MADKIGNSLLWDDSTGDFMMINGSLVTAADEASVQEWLLCNLGVQKDKRKIYAETDIGVPLRDIIGAKGKIPINTLFAVLRGAIEDTVLICPAVDKVDNIEIEKTGTLGNVTMDIATAYSDNLSAEVSY